MCGMGREGGREGETEGREGGDLFVSVKPDKKKKEKKNQKMDGFVT